MLSLLDSQQVHWHIWITTSMMLLPFTNLVITLARIQLYTLAQMQAQGFEQHSHNISGDSNIFSNLTTYALLRSGPRPDGTATPWAHGIPLHRL